MITNKQKFEELKKIHDEYGSIEPEIVVKVAEDINNPLHECFEWDDTKAGREYRTWQARQLITTVYIFTDDGDKVQVFHNIKMVDSKTAYQTIDIILSDDKKKQDLLKSALDEITYWQDKYKTIQELDGIINKKKLQEILLSFGK